MFEENEIISSAYSKISNEYRIIKTFDLNSQSSIKKIIYARQSDLYYVQETYTSIIRIFDGSFVFQDSIELNGENSKSNIVDFSFDQELQIIGMIFEGTLNLCNMKVKTAAKFINQPIKGTLKNCNKI
jgi:hypothetical protein